MRTRNLLFAAILLIAVFYAGSNAETPDELDDEVFEKEKEFRAGNEKAPAPHTPPSPSSTESSVPLQEFEDEELSTPPKVNKPVEPAAKKEPEPVQLKVEEPVIPPLRISWYLEGFYLALMLSYGLNYYFGKKTNDQLAKKWGDSLKKHLSPQFSKLGEATEGFGVVREDSSTYRIKATGRTNIFGFQAVLKLKKREDLLALFWDFIFPSYDTVTIDILPNDQLMEPFVFAAVNKKEILKFKRNNADVLKFAPNSQIFGNIAALGECEELASAFLPKEVLSILSEHEKDFVSLHFSDQNISSKDFAKSMRFVFKLDLENMNKIDILYALAIRYMDTIVEFKLSKNGRAKVDKHRKSIEDEKQKEKDRELHEAAQQRKLEKIQKTKASLSPEAQEAYEEKLAKREQKKRMKSRMVKA